MSNQPKPRIFLGDVKKFNKERLSNIVIWEGKECLLKYFITWWLMVLSHVLFTPEFKAAYMLFLNVWLIKKKSFFHDILFQLKRERKKMICFLWSDFIRISLQKTYAPSSLQGINLYSIFNYDKDGGLKKSIWRVNLLKSMKNITFITMYYSVQMIWQKYRKINFSKCYESKLE